ncbi:hypothetical protein GHK92_19025 [Nocardioides sp. dk4132]|uniref:hypothetical protein n=1 Tax=unclassified Nocardioides TaxID=2615069 RepID=UPI0012965614|nr:MULTISPECIES: hypothetical protein [unclassified Nocardioides]MQW77965.1 hypothetical protein [Nocardioides sp. dk4132]QGA09113.1 hypothetical protein GFH29_18220 [Nocardioides sp. dk884]
MLRTATAGLCLVAVLSLSGCLDPAVAPVARLGAPDRDDATAAATPVQDAAATRAEPEGLVLRSISVHGSGAPAPAGRAARREFASHTARLAREFRAVWVGAGVPGTVPGHDFYVTVTDDPAPELLERLARLPVEVEVLSGDLLTRRQYAALADDVRRALVEAGAPEDTVVGASPLGDALAVHAPVDLADLEPIATALTRVAADLDARVAPGRLAALRGAVPIRLYARSADGETVPAGGIPADRIS